MTDKQKKFCEEYLLDMNATQAAIRAGYSEKTAYSIGNENLKKPEIKNYIEERQKDLQEASGITKEAVIEQLKKYGLAVIDEKDIRPRDAIKALEIIAKLMGYDDDAREPDLDKLDAILEALDNAPTVPCDT